MATIIEVSENQQACVEKYITASLDYVRMIEHKLTEALEQIEIMNGK